MGNSFNSFNDILKSRSDLSFKSFQDLAKNSAPLQPEPVERPTNVVSNLIEKLSGVESEIEKREELSQEPQLEGDALNEALDNLMQRIDHMGSTGRVNESVAEIQPHMESSEAEPAKAYRVFKDRDETFECNLSVEGTSLSDSKVRLVLESESWNFVFYGKIYGDGRCSIPIKKGIPLVEGATGKIKLEVIAEDQLFIGWEDEFKIATSKKVKVNLKEQKAVKVSFDRSMNEKG